MPHFDIVKKNDPDVTFRVSKIQADFDVKLEHSNERFVGDIGGDFVIGDDVIASIAPSVGVVLRGADDVDLFAFDFGQIERCEWKLLFDLRFAKEG